MVMAESGLPVHFPFLLSGGGYADRIHRLFCNYVSVGQWEHASAAAHELCRIQYADDALHAHNSRNDDEEEWWWQQSAAVAGVDNVDEMNFKSLGASVPSIFGTLAALAREPAVEFVPTLSIPTRYHLSWLAATLYEGLLEAYPSSQSSFQHFAENVLQELELQVFLEALVNLDVERSAVDELRNYLAAVSTASLAGPSDLTPEAMLSCRYLLSNQPVLFAQLCNQLRNVCGMNDKLVERLERLCFEDIRERLADRDSESVYARLLGLTVSPLKSDKEFSQLAADLATACDTEVLAFEDLCGVLLGTDSSRQLLTKVCSARDKARLTMERNADLPLLMIKFVQNLIDQPENSELWQQLYQFSRRRSCHIFEYLLKTGLGYINEGRFKELEKIFSVPGLDRLAPMLLLLGWGRVSENDEKSTALLHALLPDSSRRPRTRSGARLLESTTDSLLSRISTISSDRSVLGSACRDLAFQARVARWCRDRSSAALPRTESSTAADLFRRQTSDQVARNSPLDASNLSQSQLYADLKVRTPLQVISSLVDLRRVPESDVLQLLQDAAEERPMNQSDVVTFRVFRILYRVLSIFNAAAAERSTFAHLDQRSSSDLERKCDEELAAVRVGLLSLPLQNRLDVLEDIFSFLFAKRIEGGETSYVATQTIVAAVLELIRDALTDIETSSGFTPSMAEQLSALRLRSNEARWRLAIVVRINARTNVSNPPTPTPSGMDTPTAPVCIVSLMLSSPRALLAMCLRADSYDRAREVIRMFSMEDSLLASVDISEQIDHALAEIDKGLLKISNELKSVIAEHPLVGLDVAACSAHESEMAGRLVQLAESAPKDARGVRQIEELLKALQDECQGLAFSDLITATDGTWGPALSITSTEAVVRHATLVHERHQLYDKLIMSISADTSNDSILEGNYLPAGQEENPGVLIAFMNHLHKLCGLLGPETRFNTVLRDGPTKLLRRLVFVLSELQKAEEVARVCGVDLIQLLVRCCCRPLLYNAGSVASRSESEWNSAEASSTGIAVASTEFDPLSDAVVKFLKQHAPLVATLAVMSKANATLDEVQIATAPFPVIVRAVKVLCEPACQVREAGPSTLPSLMELVEMGSSERQKLLSAQVDVLVANGKSEDALRLAEKSLSGGVPDFLLCSAADNRNSKVPAWQYVGRLRDKNIASSFLFKYMRDWPAPVCVELLRMCEKHLPRDSQSRVRVEQTLEEMEVYALIVEHNPKKWPDWQVVATYRQSSAAALVDEITALGDYRLAVRLARMCDGSSSGSLLRIVEEKELRALLDRGDTVRAQAVLQSMGKEEAFRVCSDVLAHVTSLQQRLMVVQFMLSTLGAQMGATRLHDLETLELGMLTISKLPAELQPAFEHLYQHPKLLLEQMIMNLLLDLASVIIRALPKLENADLIVEYSKKALEFPMLPVTSVKRKKNLGSRGKTQSSGASTPPSIQAEETSRNDRNIAAGTSRGPPAPILVSQDKWIPDDKAEVCMVCKQDVFGLFNRRHHCRVCGRVVCQACSSKPLTHPQFPEPLRCCDECHETYARQCIAAAAAAENAAAATVDAAQPQSPARFSTQRGESTLSMTQRKKQSLMNTSTSGSGYIATHTLSTTMHSVEDQWAGDDDALDENGEDSSSTIPASPGPTSFGVDPCGLRWILSGTNKDIQIRDSFSYDHGASTTLSMAILDLMVDGRSSALGCLRLCDHLSEHLVHGDTRIDQFLVISMIRRMCFNAKLKYLDNGAHHGVERCDTYLGRVELLRMLICGHCNGVLSIADLDEADKARRLRDRLIADDRMSLAMEVATKCRLDPNPVWAAWGLSYMRLGKFAEARDMLNHCLQSRDQSQSQSTEVFLAAVLECLESRPLIKSSEIKQLQAHMLSFVKHGSTDSSIGESIDSLLNTFKAREIRQDAFFPTSQARRGVSQRSGLDSARYEECLYYLRQYGSPQTILSFYMRHGLIDKACHHVLEESVQSDAFVQAVFLTALTTGHWSELKQCMSELDPTLNKWLPYLMHACRSLNKRNMVQVLYDVQLFMKDFIRAAMTAVKLFQVNNGEVGEKIAMLKRARLHLEDSIVDSAENRAANANASLGENGRLVMNTEDLEKYRETVALQIEVTPILGGGANMPTLFGPDKQKMEVAANLVLREDYNLAARIAKHFRLNNSRMYIQAARKLATDGTADRVEKLINAVREEMTPEQIDQLLLACIEVLCEVNQAKQAETLTNQLLFDKNRITGNIYCGKMKAAYLIAVREQKTDEIQRIKEAAEKAGPAQKMVVELCEKYLASKGK